jgi:hypothetical protein
VIKEGAAKFLGQSAKSQEGDVDDLTGARVVTTVVVNGMPQTAVELVAGVKKYRFAESLDVLEQEWLVSEINSFLEVRRGKAPQMEDMAAVDAPEVLYDADMGVTAGNMVGASWGRRGPAGPGEDMHAVAH